MKTRFYLNDTKISKKKAEELLGKEDLKKKIKEAKETFMEDSYIINSWFLGSKGMFTIEFE